MLFMVELSHGPETCIVVESEYRARRSRFLSKLPEAALEQRAEIIGGWAFQIGHKLWYVVEAPDAHAVANVFRDAELHLWNTVTINPVIGHDTFRRTVLAGLEPLGEHSPG